MSAEASEGVLSAIADELRDSPPGDAQDRLERVVELQAIVTGAGTGSFWQALLQVSLRALETAILSHEDISHIAQYWDHYAGRVHEVLAARLTDVLGVEPPEECVAHLANRLGSSRARRRENDAFSPTTEVAIFERCLSDSHDNELRCEWCGYHFREEDVGTGRYELAADLGFKFAVELLPQRCRDHLKPIRYPKSDKSPMGLELDHVVPQQGFGWSSEANGRVTCQYCNKGRLSYRRSLEPVSPVLAGAFDTVSRGHKHGLFRQLAVVSAIGASGGACSSCGRNMREAELTVKAPPNEEDLQLAILPWSAAVVCYSCSDL